MATDPEIPTYTILEADGQHPDGHLEDQIFNEDPTHAYKVHFVRAALAPSGTDTHYGTEDIADHAIGLALSLRRGILLHNDLQRSTPPAPYCPIDHPLISRSRGATFGILGLGRIGTACALRAKAFGWHVIFYDPYLPNGADKAIGVERTRSIKDLFRRSSILSIHCPATRETRNMVNYDLLSLLPKNAVLVNTARGEVVDLDAVERCLKEGGLVRWKKAAPLDEHIANECALLGRDPLEVCADHAGGGEHKQNRSKQSSLLIMLS
ncbi:hypothetical protein LTR53_002375 [Teratosphaeriaceae sp. CCFEE 6253]|nr:hypothetical protein LTR53_002375 [Teratosphaeriaceae sp. CCFEE 6253]